jgi:Flp pilus assembly pilin Flp
VTSALDERGTVTVEYAILLVLLSVGACTAIATLAALLIRLFSFQQALITLPFP